MIRMLALSMCMLVAGAAATAAGAAEQLFVLTITKGSVPKDQQLIRVDKGAAVRLRMTSDTTGNMHLHAYKIEVPFTPGVPVEVAFSAFATGRFRLEWHPDDAQAKADHHGPPLATLEVRPK